MNVKIYNLCMLVGWLMATVGGSLVDLGWGIAGGGVLLIVLTGLSMYLAGPAQPPTGGDA